jgi:hypothetical protein
MVLLFLFLMLLDRYFMKLRSVTDVIVVSFLYYPSLLHHDYLISKRGKLYRVGRHHHCPPLQKLSDCRLNDKLSYMNINCTEDVVQEKDAFVGEERASQRHSCLLSS